MSQSFELRPDDPRRLLTVVVAEETENLDQLESRIHLLLLAIAIATAIAMLLIARYAVLRGLRPVAAFARSAGEAWTRRIPQARLDTGPLPRRTATGRRELSRGC